jgi:hypothetical protein
MIENETVRQPNARSGHHAPCRQSVLPAAAQLLNAGRALPRLIAGAAIAVIAALGQASPASAEMQVGNYELHIPDRYDFHTWIWELRWCGEDCRELRSVPQPVARAYPYGGQAHLLGGRWTFTVDVPDGLRCGNVYYGQTIPTHDVYAWDSTTLGGTMVSTFDAGCDGQPGTLTYPIVLVRM